MADREKSVADRKKAGNTARKGHKSGGRQEMRGKTGANPEIRKFASCCVGKTGCLLGSKSEQSEKEGNSREKREIDGKAVKTSSRAVILGTLLLFQSSSVGTGWVVAGFCQQLFPTRDPTALRSRSS